jgi:DNA-binding Lrp family transcriptional regulator
MKLDEIDKAILELLQNDSKLNIKEIAGKTNLTKTPVYERIKKIEKAGVIDKYVAVVNRKKLAANMVVFCTVTLDSQKLEQINIFNESIAKIPEVVECYLMGGSNDFLLKVVVKDLNEYHLFSSGKLASLPNLSQIKSTFVLNEIKKSTVFPIS